MHVHQLIRDLYGAGSKHAKLKAVDCLQGHLDDPVVLPALCTASLKKIDLELRDCIIDTLETVSQDANRIFKLATATGTTPAIRKRASYNLCRLGCSPSN
jgi:hypothetical protein